MPLYIGIAHEVVLFQEWLVFQVGHKRVLLISWEDATMSWDGLITSTALWAQEGQKVETKLEFNTLTKSNSK